jgi:hypothetical protein
MREITINSLFLLHPDQTQTALFLRNESEDQILKNPTIPGSPPRLKHADFRDALNPVRQPFGVKCVQHGGSADRHSRME